jgi:hypothetical protein
VFTLLIICLNALLSGVLVTLYRQQRYSITYSNQYLLYTWDLYWIEVYSSGGPLNSLQVVLSLSRIHVSILYFKITGVPRTKNIDKRSCGRWLKLRYIEGILVVTEMCPWVRNIKKIRASHWMFVSLNPRRTRGFSRTGPSGTSRLTNLTSNDLNANTWTLPRVPYVHCSHI